MAQGSRGVWRSGGYILGRGYFSGNFCINGVYIRDSPIVIRPAMFIHSPPPPPPPPPPPLSLPPPRPLLLTLLITADATAAAASAPAAAPISAPERWLDLDLDIDLLRPLTPQRLMMTRAAIRVLLRKYFHPPAMMAGPGR